MVYSLTTITDIGNIQEENVSKEANLTILPLFLNNSNNTDVFDFGGVTRTIDLTTLVVKEVQADLVTAATEFSNLVQGAQIPSNAYPLTYVSDIHGTIKVKILSVSMSYVAGDFAILRVTLKMVESSTNG